MNRGGRVVSVGLLDGNLGLCVVKLAEGGERMSERMDRVGALLQAAGKQTGALEKLRAGQNLLEGKG